MTPPSPLTILYTILGGLALLAIGGWVKRNRLALLVPRLFTYSHISGVGQLAEIAVFNRGFKTEEAIEVNLNPQLRYELVGSTTQDVKIEPGKLSISRIGSGADVTVILLVEKGAFSKNDIVSCISKETTGKVYDSVELVPPTGNQRLALVFMFVVIPAILVLAFASVTNIVDRIISGKPSESTQETTTAIGETAAWTTMDAYKTASAGMYRDFTAGKLTPQIGQIKYKGDIATVPIKLVNETDVPMEMTIQMNSVDPEDRIPSYQRLLPNVVVAPRKAVTKEIRVVIPADATTDIERTVYIECFIESLADGETIKINRKFVAAR